MAVSLPDRELVLDGLAKLPFPVRQGLLGLVYLAAPRRVLNILPTLAVIVRDLLLGRSSVVPHARDALSRPDGLCGVALRPNVADVIEGYARGMFLHAHLGPLKWWAPRHRMVLFFDQARVERTTRRLLNNHRFRVTFDTAFTDVVRACAAPRRGKAPLTWITPRIETLFQAAHRAGYAHSVEVWQDGRLVGGAYGLAIGKLFFTESQFHRARDASKVGFAVLNRHLQAWGFTLNDGKNATRFLSDCGMTPVTRQEFTMLAQRHARERLSARAWTVDPTLMDGNWKPAQAAGVKMHDLLPAGSRCRWTAADLLARKRSNTW